MLQAPCSTQKFLSAFERKDVLRIIRHALKYKPLIYLIIGSGGETFISGRKFIMLLFFTKPSFSMKRIHACNNYNKGSN